MASIVALPAELLVKILSLLPPFGLANSRLISRYLEQVVDGSKLLQYMLELGKWGYEDVPRLNSSAADKLRTLRTIQHSWQNPQPKVTATQILELPEISNRWTTWWTAHDGVLVRHTRVKPSVMGSEGVSCTHLDLISVPEVLKDPNTWTSFILRFPCSQLVVDAGQNLMVALESDGACIERLHVLSTISGETHPEAQCGVITISRPGKDVSIDVTVQAVIGPFLCINVAGGLHGGPGFPSVELLHWPTGECVKVWEGKSSTFISPNILLIAGTHRSQDHLQHYVQVWTIPTTFSPQNAPVYRAKFQFPTVPSNSYSGMWFEHGLSDVVFMTDLDFRSPQHSLVSLHQGGHDLITSTRIFRDACTPQMDHTAEPLLYPWLEWGPRSTLLVNTQDPIIARCGYRVLFRNEIWDFTPHGASDSAPSSSQNICHIHQADCPYSRIEDATLPYRRVQWDFPRHRGRFSDLVVETTSGPKCLRFRLSRPFYVDVISF